MAKSARQKARDRLVHRYNYWRNKVNPLLKQMDRQQTVYGHQSRDTTFQSAKGKTNSFLREQIKEMRGIVKDIHVSPITGKVYRLKNTKTLRSNLLQSMSNHGLLSRARNPITGRFTSRAFSKQTSLVWQQALTTLQTMRSDILQLFYEYLEGHGTLGVLTDFQAWYDVTERYDPLSGEPYTIADAQAQSFMGELGRFDSWLQANYGITRTGRKVE